MSASPGSPVAASSEPTFVRQQDVSAGVVTGPERWYIAPLRNRTAAWTADLVIATLVATVLCLPFWAVDPRAWPFSDHAGLFADVTDGTRTGDIVATSLMTLVLLVVWIVVVAWPTAQAGEHHGQSLGKRMFNVRVLRANGDPLERGEAWWRAAFWPVVLFGPSVLGNALDAVLKTAPLLSNISDGLEWLVIGTVIGVAFFRRDRRAPYEQWGDTIVVQARPIGQRPPGGPVPRSGELPIQDRERTADSWILVVVALVAVLIGIVSAF